MNLTLEIITPEKIVYKDEVNEIIVETVDGQIGILPNHVGLLTQIVPGELIIKKGSSTQFLAITGGFLEVIKNKATILADYAVRSEEIEVVKAIEAQKRAEQSVKEAKEKAIERDFAIAESELRRAILELKVAQKRRKSA
ncbi:MAG: ATP synthase F1 subunit epsilon [Patescibacteria group bacterium]|nr:ATP synthase F1 subunit epsilon [Patescibacteria group bacterium]